MAAELLSIIALFLFLPLAKLDSIDEARRDVLQAVGGIVDFYDLDYYNLNVDGLFGLRVLEGHLEALLMQYEAGELTHISVDMIDDMKIMKEKTTRSSELAVSHVKKDGIEYYKQMSYVVNAPWSIFDHQHRKVNSTLSWSSNVYANAKRSVNLDEELSDMCMSELIGSHKSHGKACDISSKCADTMTKPGLLGYGITHQVLWTMLAEKAGCLEKLNIRLLEIGRGDLLALRQELCSNNYIQMRETMKKMPNGILVPSVQDLFLEQLFVCPSLGYYEFLDLDFLPQVLSWQSQNGCYGKMKKTSYKVKLDKELTGKFKEEYEDINDVKVQSKFNDKADVPADEVRELKRRYKAEVDKLRFQDDIIKDKNGDDVKRVWEMTNNTGRRLLVEKSMSDGCLAHKTAVASGALVMYLRYLFAADANQLFSSKRKLRSAEPPLGHRASNMQEPGFRPVDVKSKLSQKLGISQHDLGLGALKGKQSLVGPSLNENAFQNLEKFQHAFKQHKNKSSASLNKHHQVAAPRFFDKDGKLKETYDNNHLALNNNVEPSKDDENYDYKYDDDNNERDDDDDEGDEDDDYDDGDDYDDDDGGGDIKDDDFNAYHEKPGGKIVRNMNNYYNGGGRGDDRQGMNNIGPDDDNDDDYNADDGYDDGYDDNDQENVHPHINARNIGHGKSKDYDKEVYEDDKEIKAVKDYDDDEEGDDYEYDDENDEMEKRRQEELKNEFILAKTSDKKVVDIGKNMISESAITEQSMLSKTPYIILVISLICVIILYRLIKRRRIRLKIGHKYFHV